MSKKPVEVPNIGFNEALNRIAKFDKNELSDNRIKTQKTPDVKKEAKSSVDLLKKKSKSSN